MPKTAAPISIRLDTETACELRRLAYESGGTISSVVREAVAHYAGAQQQQQAAGEPRPYDRLRHLIGAVDARPDRSVRTGERLRAVLKAKARARRPR